MLSLIETVALAWPSVTLYVCWGSSPDSRGASPARPLQAGRPEIAAAVVLELVHFRLRAAVDDERAVLAVARLQRIDEIDKRVGRFVGVEIANCA